MVKGMTREYGFPPAAVDIKTRDGRLYSIQVDFPFGTPGNPMAFTDVILKFKECCRYSARPIPMENQDKAIRMVGNLEEIDDVGRFARLLA
jgi:2-methylcitrate dehydratase PrpD